MLKRGRRPMTPSFPLCLAYFLSALSPIYTIFKVFGRCTGVRCCKEVGYNLNAKAEPVDTKNNKCYFQETLWCCTQLNYTRPSTVC